MSDTFDEERLFEEALIYLLTKNGWADQVLHYPTEEDLIRNWADILFRNNQGIDELNDVPLSDGEMAQVLEQVRLLSSPLQLNGFINGGSVTIIRDNKEDVLHYGSPVSLYLFDKRAVSGGPSVYQIAEQPMFKSKNAMFHDRRGDFMLLINGIPVIHVELKKTGIPLSQAYNQIDLYNHEHVFTGIFSLIQFFVAMTPSEMVYFANPGDGEKLNKDYFFHWEDFNNEIQGDWKYIARHFLNIPMAHQMVGSYTVADHSDGILKVMRSYQYFASSAISDKVAQNDWMTGTQRGGYIWHTTGSGKTMTSFKSAELISQSDDADKVIFLVDRIELASQSYREYSGFAGEGLDVQQTDDTADLLEKLLSDDAKNQLIITSIQKMSRVKAGETNVTKSLLAGLEEKRIVIIVDEAHRSTFGDMLLDIKHSFPRALFFGFTGTPIQLENQKKMNTTATVFGDELHRYSLADGIRDKNVLGFDPYMVKTYRDLDLRRSVALDKAKAKTEAEAMKDKEKKKVYLACMQLPMAGDWDEQGKYHKGIEDYLSEKQYDCEQHRRQVISDVKDNWLRLSDNGKFHAIFAASSIPEAIAYYGWFKHEMPDLHVTAIFDPTLDLDGEGFNEKEDAIIEIMEDYNALFGQNFTMKSYGRFKKDVMQRLAHKEPYQHIDDDPSKQLNLVIVVNQLLTGYDSKWLNTLYLDKLLEYENVIQAFSRTNRLFGPDKPFGTIHYYRRPYTMKRNVERAVKLYSGDKVFGLFVDRLGQNVKRMNEIFSAISDIFAAAGIHDFQKLPEDIRERGKFASLFNQLKSYLEAARIQGFRWENRQYPLSDRTLSGGKTYVSLSFDQLTYMALLARYKELALGGTSTGGTDLPYDIDTTLIEQDTGMIDADYMNSRFEKYMKQLGQPEVTPEQLADTLNQLHKSFAYLSQEEQKAASLFLNDVSRGAVTLSPNKTFRDYITDYRKKLRQNSIYAAAHLAGIRRDKLEEMMNLGLTEETINEFGRLDTLLKDADLDRVKEYMEKVEGKKLPLFKVRIKLRRMMTDFIIHHEIKVDDKVQETEDILHYLGLPPAK